MNKADEAFPSKGKIDRAGKALVDPTTSDVDIIAAYDLLEKWRAYHLEPLKRAKKMLQKKSLDIDPSSVVVGREKRIAAVIQKLKLHQELKAASTSRMNLSRMQDFVGCRAVLKDLKGVNELKSALSQDNEITISKVFDYIQTPNSRTGYRGIHLVYRYQESSSPDAKANSLPVEIQLRTQMQHVWAVSVETISLLAKQPRLKSGVGDKKWVEFFLLISAVMSLLEGTEIPESVRQMGLLKKEDLIAQIKKSYGEQLECIVSYHRYLREIGGAFSRVNQFIDRIFRSRVQRELFLIDFDLSSRRTKVRGFRISERPHAEALRSDLEKKYRGLEDRQVVLVAAQKLSEAKDVYSSYFSDLKRFIDFLKDNQILEA